MSYQLELTLESNYLMAVAAGQQTALDNEKMVIKLVEMCIEHDLHQVVADLTGLVGQPGTFSDFQLANFAVEQGLPLIKKVGLVTTPENLEFTAFFETAARNRGLNVRTFIDRDKAVAWMDED
jgi:hypothetical protein